MCIIGGSTPVVCDSPPAANHTTSYPLFPQACQDLVRGDRQATAVLELGEDAASQDLLGQDAALALGRHHARADRRALRLELLVDILLEAQTALQPSTPSRNLRRVERRLLQL